MSTDSERERIGEVLAVCKDRWRSSGIPEDRVRLMAEEVKEDLRYATENGRTVEEVVGPDVREFASLYVADEGSPDSPKDRALTWTIVAVLLLIVAVGLALRFLPLLDSWLPWFAAVALVAVAAALLLFWPGRSR